MSVETREEQDGKVLNVVVSGKLEADDYEQFGPKVERLMDRHGKIRVLLETRDFRGWDAGALWEDIKFNWEHFSDIERLAIVGEKKWEKGMATFCKPFTTAEIRFFEPAEIAEAQRWVES